MSYEVLFGICAMATISIALTIWGRSSIVDLYEGSS